MGVFKAIELHAASRARTGREYQLDAASRQAAVEDLLRVLNVPASEARVDPTRTMVEVGQHLWTLIALRQTEEIADPSRRAGAKHKRVR